MFSGYYFNDFNDFTILFFLDKTFMFSLVDNYLNIYSK